MDTAINTNKKYVEVSFTIEGTLVGMPLTITDSEGTWSNDSQLFKHKIYSFDEFGNKAYDITYAQNNETSQKYKLDISNWEAGWCKREDELIFWSGVDFQMRANTEEEVYDFLDNNMIDVTLLPFNIEIEIDGEYHTYPVTVTNVNTGILNEELHMTFSDSDLDFFVRESMAC